MLFSQQKGFTLIELMVAMVVGLIVILGAGQLFLTTFQTFNRVGELSRKQEALIFSAETLVRDIRKAEAGSVNWDSGGKHLELDMSSTAEDECGAGISLKKQYYLSARDESGKTSYYLSLRDRCEDEGEFSHAHPLVDGFFDDTENSFMVTISDGKAEITIRLAADNEAGFEEYIVHAHNRLSVFN